jgi:peptide/nickel transport system substrate-binding protein
VRNRGIVIFLLFAFLIVIVVFQFMATVQSERLCERLSRAGDVLEDALVSRAVDPKVNFPSNEYSGDEGDWLIWAMHAEPKTLNQLSVEADIYSKWIAANNNILEPLLTYNWQQVKMEPLLAESYEISGDGLEITYVIRDDVHFSDGIPVTADDVMFTYETIMNPAVDASNFANMYEVIDSVVKVNERTVKFIMKRPYFKALELTSFWDIGIHPKHIYEFDDAAEFNNRVSNPVGSGPYVFEKWDHGSKIVLSRNKNYWGRKPRLKKVIYRFIPNDVARLQALRAYEVDMIIPSQEQFAELLADEEFNEEFDCIKYWNPGAPFYFIGWNQEVPFFADRKVRLALTHLVNRPQIVSELLKGMAEETTGPFFIKGNQNDPAVKPWPYDIEKGKKLLEEAGWVDTDGDGIRDKDGVPFRFKFMYDSINHFYKRLVKLVKDDFARAGIDVVPDPFEWSIIMEKVVSRDFEVISMGWGGDILEDVYQIFHSSQSKNRGNNYVGFSSKEADSIMEQIRLTMDEGLRDELSRELHGILHHEQPYTFIYARPTFRLVDKRFENVNVHYMGLNYLEWFVPKEKQRYK